MHDKMVTLEQLQQLLAMYHHPSYQQILTYPNRAEIWSLLHDDDDDITIPIEIITTLPSLLYTDYIITVDNFTTLLDVITSRSLRFATFDVTAISNDDDFNEYIVTVTDPELACIHRSFHDEYGRYWYLPIIIDNVVKDDCPSDCQCNNDITYHYRLITPNGMVEFNANQFILDTKEIAQDLYPQLSKLWFCHYNGYYDASFDKFTKRSRCLGK